MRDLSNQFELKVLVKGRPITEYNHTDGQIYIEGRRGSEFELEFDNKSWERILVVPSVDGLSVMDGRTAGVDSDGYVIEPRHQLRIPGWRLDEKNVAKFVFENTCDSYANRTGRGQSNNGVIGLLVFRAKAYYVPSQWLTAFPSYDPYFGVVDGTQFSNPAGSFVGSNVIPMGINSLQAQSTTAGDNNATFIGASITANASSITNGTGILRSTPQNMVADLGTGFGDQTDFQTYDTTFEKRDPNNPDAIMVCYYDSKRNLLRRGVNLGGRYGTPGTNPFPGYKRSSGVTPPPGWQSRS